MANESTPPPWLSPDPNQNTKEQVVLPEPPQLEFGHLQQFKWEDATPPSPSGTANVDKPQVVVGPPPTPIVTTFGKNGEVPTAQAVISTSEPASPTSQDAPSVQTVNATLPVTAETSGSNASFDASAAKAFLDSLPVKKEGPGSSQQSASASPVTDQPANSSVPLEAGAQSVVSGNDAVSQNPSAATAEQGSDNGYPMAPGLMDVSADASPAQTATSAVASVETLPSTTAEATTAASSGEEVTAVKPETAVTESATSTPEQAPQAIGTLVDSPEDKSVKPKNWRVFGQTLPKTIGSVNTQLSSVINNITGPKDEDSRKGGAEMNDQAVSEENNISPFGDPMPKPEDNQPPQLAKVIPFPAKPAAETIPSVPTQSDDEPEVVAPQSAEPAHVMEPVAIPTPTMNEYLANTPSDSTNVESVASSSEPARVESQPEAVPPHEKKIINFEKFREEKLNRIRKAREIELLKIAYHKDAAEKAERADRALLGQEQYIKSLDPISYATVDNALNGEIPDIDRLTIKELEEAA